jgi:spermidine synthase
MPGQYLNIPIRSDRLSQTVFVKSRLFLRRSRFQSIEIFDTEAYGKVLTLDGHIQLTELDEHAYHEALVQVPLLSIDAPKTALVVGGGDGGAIREICKHKGVARVDLVEIDAAVIEACSTLLPGVSGGAFEDERVKVHVADAFAFVKKAEGPYDLIVVDSTDTYENEQGALSEQIFTSEFFADCRRLLSSGGFLVTQADNPVFCPYSMVAIMGLLKGCFPKTGRYHAVIPSFGGFSGFCWASNGAVVRTKWSEIDASGVVLSYLNEATYNFALAPLPF